MHHHLSLLLVFGKYVWISCKLISRFLPLHLPFLSCPPLCLPSPLLSFSSAAAVCCVPSVLHNGVKNKSLWRLLHWCVPIGAGALELLQWGAAFSWHWGSGVAVGCAGQFCFVPRSNASWENNGGGGGGRGKKTRPKGGEAGNLRNNLSLSLSPVLGILYPYVLSFISFPVPLSRCLSCFPETLKPHKYLEFYAPFELQVSVLVLTTYTFLSLNFPILYFASVSVSHSFSRWGRPNNQLKMSKCSAVARWNQDCKIYKHVSKCVCSEGVVR